MQVNESVWSSKENWREISATISGTETKDKILGPGFDSQEPAYTAGTILKGMQNNFLYLNTEPWDKSLSWCGLGNQHPLSNVSWMGLQKYDPGTTPDNHIIMINQDRRTVTNFCFGVGGGQDNQWPGYYWLDGEFEQAASKFQYQRWAPYAEFSSRYSCYQDYIPLTQVPAKRAILIPFITCVNSSGDLQSYDLLTFLQHRSTYKYIIQVKIQIYYDYNPSLYPDFDELPLEGFTRTGLSGLKCISVLDSTTAAKNYPVPGTQDTFTNIYLYNQMEGYGGGMVIAGSKYDTGWSRGDSNFTWTIPVYNGFGLNFNTFTNSTTDNIPTSSSRLVCDISEMSDEQITESVRRCVACFGMFFVDGERDKNLPLDDENMFLGLLEDGVGNGAYSHGQDNRNAPQWQLDDLHEIDYDPGNPPSLDPNIYDAAFGFSNLTNFKTATKRYNLSEGQIVQLYGSLWTIWSSWLDQDDKPPQTNELFYNSYKTFLSNDPLDCIVSCKYFPIDSNKISLSDGSSTAIKVGAVTLTQGGTGQTEIQAPPAKSSIIYDCGTVYVWPVISGKGQTWLDNYDSLELYLPFCGSLKLDVATYMGKYVGVDYHIDLITGNCTAAVYILSAEYNNKVYMEIRNGNCGIDVPLSGIQQATLDANLFNATQTAKSASINLIGSTLGNFINTGAKAYSGDALGAVTGGISGLTSLASGVVGMQSAQYNLNHVQLPTRLIGCATPLSSAECNLTPILIHTRPKPPTELADYGKTTGYSCIKHTTVGALGGYTVASNVKLDNIAATAAEKEMIRSLCASGIYV